MSPKMGFVWEEKDKRLAKLVSDLLEMAGECFIEAEGPKKFEDWERKKHRE